MKKLMISTIILLPLLILAIMLVSGAIMSMVTYIYVDTVEFVDKSDLVLYMEDEANPPTETLKVNVLPIKAQNKAVSFTSQDESIVTVDENGVVTARGFGETYVTVTSVESVDVKAQRKVKVTDDAVHSVAITNKADVPQDMYVGDEAIKLKAQILPEKANQSVEWASSNPNVLSVDAEGTIKCLGFGEATVTVTSKENAEFFDSVTVKCHNVLRKISVDTAEATHTTAKAEAKFPQLTFLPNSDPDYKVTYTSSDENVATIDTEGNITVKNAGYVTMTASAVDGRNNQTQAVVTYFFTNGYFLGDLFDPEMVTSFDYDQYAGKTLPIEFKPALEGSYREIMDVTFSRSGIVTYDKTTQKFSLAAGLTSALGDVTITVHAKKYDTSTNSLKEVQEDVRTVSITRKTTALYFDSANVQDISGYTTNSAALSLYETQTPSSGIGVRVVPVNHTDKLTFALKQTDNTAQINQTEHTLVFAKEGAVTVVVTVEGNSDLSKELTITYTKPKADDVTQEVNLTTAVEQQLTLDFHDDDNKAGLQLNITDEAGYTHDIVLEEDNGVVSVNKETGTITPLKGGFATINVVFTPISTVSFFSARNSSPDQKTISYTIYVDKDITPATDVTFSLAPDHTTSKDSLSYTITFNVEDDVLEGKKVLFNGQETQLSERKISGEVTFASDEFDKTLSVAVRYTQQAIDCGKTDVELGKKEITWHTTHNKLNSNFTVEGLDEGNALHFDNIGVQKTLTVKVESPSPADFELQASHISFGSNAHFSYTIANVVDNAATITLTADKGTTTGETVTLTVAGKTLGVKVTVDAQADTIALSCTQNSALASGTNYNTFLPTLTVTISISRKQDSNAVTNQTITYVFNGQSHTVTADNGDYTLALTLTDGSNTLTVNSGTASEFTFAVNKYANSALWEKVSYYMTYTVSSDSVTLDSFSMTDATTTEIFLPKGIQGSLVIHADLNSQTFPNLLGAFDDSFGAMFNFVATGHNWTPTFSASDATFTLEIPNDEYFGSLTCTFVVVNHQKTFVFNRMELEAINFTSETTSFNNNTYDDVYKGYQQVRVFAKHSYYTDRSGDKTVDFFAIPLNAYSKQGDTSGSHASVAADLDQLVWDLTKYVDDHADANGYSVVQRGKTVTVTGGNAVSEYTIVPVSGQDSKLTDKEGNVVAEGGKFAGDTKVAWVDVYAKSGEARIYFGDFVGLSEVDVQNDYFGNFGRPTDKWTKATIYANDYDGSGRNFAPSDGAFSYLRVTVGDGAERGVSTYFNFNVLQDDSLVNVFDADGYYNNQNIVLHNDLYGNGELEPSLEATKKAQILDKEPQKASNDQSYAKNTIYGNGYQANLNKLNDMIVGTGPTTSSGGMMNHDGQENTGNATYFTSLYNVRLMGRNSNETINSASFAILFNVKNIYYTDLQNYSKMNPMGGSISIKNSVLHNVAVQALQLWNEASTPAATRGYWNAYLENVTIVNATKGISIEGSADKATSKYHTLYIKGHLDALNYNNVNGLMDLIASGLGGDSVLSTITQILACAQYDRTRYNGREEKFGDYIEWFGAQSREVLMGNNEYTGDMVNPFKVVYKGYENIFVNPVIVDTGVDGSTFMLNSAGQPTDTQVGGMAGSIMCWNDNENQYVNIETASSASNLLRILDGRDHDTANNSMHVGNWMITAYTYDEKNSTDGGLVINKPGNDPYGKSYVYNSRMGLTYSRPEIEKLFSSDRYIRLLCQYLGVDGKGKPIRNDDHILWHMQRCYRDVSLIDGRENDHIQALIQSLNNAVAKNVWDGNWPDGTTLQQALEAYRSHNG